MPHLVLALIPLASLLTSDGPAVRPILKTPGYVVLSPTIVRGAVKEVDPPKPDEVLKAVGLRRTADVRVILEKRSDYVDPPRVYPTIGRAQLHHMHYECTVESAGGSKRFFVSQNHFHVLEK
ncbi:MAG: hypothetical protein HYX69_06780 [Planctomycetia bacterium]|nr:hypothetical protein [Planctomycetia bacterium]